MSPYFWYHCHSLTNLQTIYHSHSQSAAMGPCHNRNVSIASAHVFSNTLTRGVSGWMGKENGEGKSREHRIAGTSGICNKPTSILRLLPPKPRVLMESHASKRKGTRSFTGQSSKKNRVSDRLRKPLAFCVQAWHSVSNQLLCSSGNNALYGDGYDGSLARP